MTRTARKAQPKMAATLKAPVSTEAEITAQVLDACRMLGITLERQNTGGMHNVKGRYVAFGQAGDSDFRGTLPGGLRFGLEVKRPGRRPTEAQLTKLRKLNADGAVGIWTDDPAKFLRLMPWILCGKGWVEIDSDGGCFVCHE